MANPECHFGTEHSVLTARLDPHLWGRCRPDLWQTGKASSRKIQEPLASENYKAEYNGFKLGCFKGQSLSDIFWRQMEKSLLRDKVIKVMSEIAQYQRIFRARILITLFCRSLSKNATDWPWRFPEGEVRGVLISAWASTQIRQRSGHCWAWPSTEPIARL